MGAEVPETVQDVAVVVVSSREASAATSTAVPAVVLPALPSATSPHAAASSAAGSVTLAHAMAIRTAAATCATAAPLVTRSRPASAPRQHTKWVALYDETLSAESDTRVQAVREESALRMKVW